VQVAKRHGDRYDTKQINAICDRGLKKALSSDKHYKVRPRYSTEPSFNAYLQLLKQLRQQFVKRIEVRRRKDPLTVLPVEMLDMVMSHLEFKEIV
jgi:hypothetical protein